jgi:dolichol-phosphate mannosyltransferase
MPKNIPTGSIAPVADSCLASSSEGTAVLPLSAVPCRRLEKLSIVIPARDEAGCIASTVEHLHLELSLHRISHEIIVVDDGSRDETYAILESTAAQIPNLVPVRSPGPHGFGRAIQRGLDAFRGDAVVIMMADESDDCRDVVRYWRTLQEGHECVFGSRFTKGGGTIDYPWIKWILNRCANFFVRILFGIRLNDTTNAFKAYRREVIDGCRPFLSPHFNITVELPLKAIVRGYSWTVIPITWRNRRTGVAKLKIREMGSRYFFIVAYVWLEKYFSRGDYRKLAAMAPKDGHETIAAA